MGIQDRDYYREDYAEKNRMHYRARNATYTAAPVSSTTEVSKVQRIAEDRRSGWLAFWGKIALVVTAAVAFILFKRYS